MANNPAMMPSKESCRLMKKQSNSSLKAHLLPGGTYILPVICAIPFALAQPSSASCSVNAGCGSVVTTPPIVFDVDVSEPVDSGIVQPSDFMCNGIPAHNVFIINGNMTVEFTYNTSPAVPGVNTIHIPAGAFGCGPVVDLNCTFRLNTPRATPTPRARPTPLPRPSS
jgi:hypothetical protein